MMKYASTYDTHILTEIVCLPVFGCDFYSFSSFFLFLRSVNILVLYILHMATKAILIPLLKNYFK